MSERRKPDPWTFEPREFVDEPKRFGKDHKSIPFTGPHSTPEERVRSHTAQLQHLIADAVRRGLKGQPLNKYIDAQGETSGLRYNRLIRMQRGEMQMQLSDVVTWAAHMPEVKLILTRYLESMTPIDVNEGGAIT